MSIRIRRWWLGEVVKVVETFYTYIIWGMVPTAIICMPLKISPPSLIGQSPIQWKGADLRSGTDTPSPGISLKGIYNKTHKFVDLMWEYYLRTRLGWFLLLFPCSYFHAIFLPETNDAIYRRTVTMGELLNTLGCRFWWSLWWQVVTDAHGLISFLWAPHIYIWRDVWKNCSCSKLHSQTHAIIRRYISFCQVYFY